MWVRFLSDFDWRQPGFTIAYKAGMVENVTRACAAAAGDKVEPVEKAKKDVPEWTENDPAQEA